VLSCFFAQAEIDVALAQAFKGPSRIERTSPCDRIRDGQKVTVDFDEKTGSFTCKAEALEAVPA
jgi:hypothetical protein